MEGKSVFAMTAMLAQLMPTEVHIEKLKEAISKYDTARIAGTDTKEAEKEIGMFCMMFLQKQIEADPFDMVKELEEMERGREILKPKQG